MKVEDRVARLRQSAHFAAAERDANFVAVCLIGPRRMQPKTEGNALWWPVGLRVNAEVGRAAARADIENWSDGVHVLAHRWTVGDTRGRRLKAALDKVILGDDPALRMGRKGWRDWPEWEYQWSEAVAKAVAIVEAKGGLCPVFEDWEKLQILLADTEAREKQYG